MLSRREFMGWLAGLIPAAAVVRRAHAASVAHLAAAPETLDALGAAVLPAELGSAQVGQVVAGFRRWIDGYRENAELNHGYGNSRLRFSGPTPATRWTKQLDDLDAAARSAHGSSFATLTVAQRQEIVRPLIAAERGIPGVPTAERTSHWRCLASFMGRRWRPIFATRRQLERAPVVRSVIRRSVPRRGRERRLGEC